MRYRKQVEKPLPSLIFMKKIGIVISQNARLWPLGIPSYILLF